MSTTLHRSVSENSNVSKGQSTTAQTQRRTDWSKMHDRKLTSDQRQRMVNAIGQQKLTHQQMVAPVTITSHNSCNLENVNLSNPEGITRGLTKDFLTLACYNAIATGQTGLLKAVYKTGKAPQVDKQGNTPLHIAARCGQLRSLRWLLQYSSTPIQAKNCRGETPLHVAGLHGNLHCLQTLVLSQTDNIYHVISERDNMGMTVLHHATIGNRDNAVAWLAEEFGKDLCLVKSVDGVLAIHLAAAAGNRFCTQILADVCRQTINMRDMFGATAAFYAAQEGHLLCLEYLVEEAGSNLGIVACEGMTAILTAAEGGHLDVFQYILMKQGHSVLLESTNDGATVFHYASGNGHYQILKFLLDLPNTSDLLRLCDTNDRSPAHDAADNGNVDCLKLIVDAGMSVYQPDKDGETPLSLAMKCGNPKCAMFAKVVSETAIDKNSLKAMKKKMGSKFPMISNILTIQALSKSDAKHFKSGKCAEWKGAIPNTLLQKKKMVRNMDTVENESLSMKSDGIYVWPSWQRSLASREANRPTSRGIFRGEFILLRSSPPGTLNSKTRKISAPNRNGHLYAQRNRPCPISLPLQKHEYPTHINQMDVEDDINPDDIERFFKQPLDVIPEYGNVAPQTDLYQLEEEDDSCHELDNEPDCMPYSYTTQTLDRHFGLKEAQTSFSMWDRRPYRKARPFPSSATPSEDYSSDESGISTESGISSHSDDDKNGYNPSSSDESGTSKRYSDSGDSAVKDSYCMSSDDEDIKMTKRKKSLYLSEILKRKEIVEIHEPQKMDHSEKSDDQALPMSEGSDDVSIYSKPESIKQPTKNIKRMTKNVTRKRSESVYSSEDEGMESLSSSFMCLASANNRNNSICSYASSSACSSLSTDSNMEGVPDTTKAKQSLPKEISVPKPMVTESLASVLQRSMFGTAALKNTLKSNSVKDNTCKTVFNSASLSRENKKKTLTRSSTKCTTQAKMPVSYSPSFRSELPLPQIPVQHSEPKHQPGAIYESHQNIDTIQRVYRSKSVTVSDLQQQLANIIPCDQIVGRRPSSKKFRAPLPPGTEPTTVKIVEEVKPLPAADSCSDEDIYAVPKAASKIKALQDVLMKQSLPFANPFIFKANKVGSIETLTTSPKEEVLPSPPKQQVEKPIIPPVPPPPPPPPATLPKVKKAESPYAKCVSYATTTKVHTEKDDCQLDDATKTRIASIKSMLERASVVEDAVSISSKCNSEVTAAGIST